MTKTAILITFDNEGTEGAREAIFSALAELDITPDVSVKVYDGKYGGPVIYFP